MAHRCAGREEVVASSRRRSVVTLGVAGVLVLLVAVVPTTSASATPSTSVRSTPLGSLLATLNDPAATLGDRFGYTVAVSGKTAVVGAPSTNVAAGAAYIYVKGASGWPTTPTATLSNPTATQSEIFGETVAVSGTTVVVGAPDANSSDGAAYIYVKGASGWPTMPTTTLSDPAAAVDDSFGSAVGVSGTTVVVGAPNTNSSSGASYIYVEGASGWPTTPTTTLLDPGAIQGDAFGYSVGVSDTTVVVGAPQYLGSSQAGVAYIYVKGASGWPTTSTATLLDPTATTNDLFGWSVAVWGPYTKVVVGAPGTSSDTGTAYIYQKGSALLWPTTPSATLSDPAATSGDSFGQSVAVSKKTVVVGAPNTDDIVGAAYVFVKADAVWPTTPTTTLSDPAASANEAFGSSVAFSGKTAVVGAPAPPPLTHMAGTAYIYKA
jgi:hypothetical protein